MSNLKDLDAVEVHIGKQSVECWIISKGVILEKKSFEKHRAFENIESLKLFTYLSELPTKKNIRIPLHILDASLGNDFQESVSGRFLLLYTKGQELYQEGYAPWELIEVLEAIDEKGQVDVQLSEPEMNNCLRRIFSAKAQLVVLAFNHSQMNPIHESNLKHVIRAAGIKNVFASSDFPASGTYHEIVQNALNNAVIRLFNSALVNDLEGGLKHKFILQFH